MQPNNTLTTAAAKRVIKMTGKAKAALEEKGIRSSSKKRKPDSTGDSMNPQPKKAKTNLPAGNAPTSCTDKDRSVTTSSPSPTPPPVVSQRAVVRTEEEEAALYEDDDEVPKDSDEEDELGTFNNLHIDISALIKYSTTNERVELTCLRIF
jgi:hypothetical protein